MEIIKASGEKELFNKSKFCLSLKKAGAPGNIVDEVCSKINEELKPGMTTTQIFRKASQYLMKDDFVVAANYSLKRGIAALGPAGFNFEKFLAVVIGSLGYKVKLNQMMKGRCVTHEVDLTAERGNEHFLIEAKYHNGSGIKTHIDVAMYADARLADIAFIEEQKESAHNNHKMWLITNTEFTKTALRYGRCRNLKLTSWRGPAKEGLKDIIIKNKLYPITVLPSVNKFAQEEFVKHNMMLARDLAPYSADDLVRIFNFDRQRADKIIKEVQVLIY
ncbi:MAG: ATP cone domain-containing protein [Parcubacteria group bacterium]|nr:ATP cone domain-containing protein [Parcubacteria group bacterium]MCR4342348.1 ATP cone domain-containing protein [Patescibacteria group bacterium]